MTLATNIANAFTRVGTEFKAVRTLIGGSGTADISALTTTDKSSLVAAINETKAGNASSPPDASTTTKGIIEIATLAEVTTGTDTTRAVTPQGVKQEIDLVKVDGKLAKASNLSDLADIPTARTNLGLGSAATTAASAYDAAGAAADAQAAAISAAASDATTKADAKVADAINDGVTTVAPSQNAVFDALALKVPSSRTIAGLDLSADRTAAALKTALSLVKADVGLGSVDNTADSAKTLAATQITTGTIDTDRLPDVPYTVKLAPAAAFGALGATVGEHVHGTIWSGTNLAVNASQYVLARSKVRGIAERFGFWFISATAAPGDTFYVVCYAPNANGMPGALLWSVGVLVSSLSVGANVLSGLTHPIPAGAYVGVKNGSTTGAVTLRSAGTSATHSPLADISGNYNGITATAAGPPAPTAPSGFGLAQNFPSMIVRGV